MKIMPISLLWTCNHGQILTSDFTKHVFPFIPQISMLLELREKVTNKNSRHERNIEIRGKGMNK